MKFTQVSLGVVSLVAITALVAAKPGDGQRWGHGSKSVADIEARGAQIFAKLDADGNGGISEEEFTSAELPEGRHQRGRHGPGKRFDRSQQMPEAIREELADKVFEAADQNGDGVLSREEARNIRANRNEVMRSFRFTHMDSNGDSILTPDEFPRFAAHAREMDTNGDGELSHDEMRAGFAKRKEQGRAG